MHDELAAVTGLELRLLRPEVRTDRAALGRLLHPDFVEVGSSGRLWGRQDIMDETAGHLSDEVVAFDLNARFLADDVVLVTYITTHAEKNVHRAQCVRVATPAGRSSITRALQCSTSDLSQ